MQTIVINNYSVEKATSEGKTQAALTNENVVIHKYYTDCNVFWFREGRPGFREDHQTALNIATLKMRPWIVLN